MRRRQPPERRDPLKLFEVLDSDEPLVMVIRGHLWIEHELQLAMWRVLELPEVLSFDRLTFERKIELAVAVGVLEETEMPAYLAANALRNRFAHDPEMEIDAATADRLVTTLTPELRSYFVPDRVIEEDAPHEAVARCFAALALHAAVQPGGSLHRDE
jgi:hypothetical protein